MPEYCDRCPQPALIAWWHPETKAELGACRHHSREWAPVLLDQGWLQIDREPVPA